MPGLMSIRAQIRQRQAAGGRPRHRLAAHDHSDRGAHRDAGRSRRRRALGKLQHLLHPGPRRCRHCRRRRPGLRLEGRDARRILVVHVPGGEPCGRQGPATRRRRRRRRHPAHPQGLRTGRRQRLGQHSLGQPRRDGHQRPAEEGPRREDPQRWHKMVKDWRGVSRRDHHRRASPLQDAGSGQAAGSRHQRQRFGHQVASSTTCTAAANRWPTASSAPPT